jgi:hypothetical protein
MTAELIFIVQALAVLVLPVVVWRGLRLRGAIPLVVVQILVGIALGPALLGRIAPEAFDTLFQPQDPYTALGGGLDRCAAVRLRHWAAPRASFVCWSRLPFAAIAATNAIVPMAAGFLGGLWIAARQPAELGEWDSPIGFAMAIGIAVGVTALPVLGAILREMDLLGGGSVISPSVSPRSTTRRCGCSLAG